jgi:hypothetical protein
MHHPIFENFFIQIRALNFLQTSMGEETAATPRNQTHFTTGKSMHRSNRSNEPMHNIIA